MNRFPVHLPIPLTQGTVEIYGRHLGIDDPSRALEALAAGLASSPGWPANASPVVIGRADPRPQLAVFGHFAEHEIEALRLQARYLDEACRRLRFYDFPRVVNRCIALADLLGRQLGAEISTARFVAIARGGFSVLGLLSTALDLDRCQLDPSGDPAELLVVVDDCAVSGARFAEQLPRWPNHRIVFAHLCSHPELRRAIESSEPRVEACLAADDLLDRPEPASGDDWRQVWRSKTTWKTYWTGSPRAIGFPWGEPDRCLWNPSRQRIERAWNLLPPFLCLKNRQNIPVQIQPPCPGPLHAADGVFFCLEGTRAHLANPASGESLVLDEVATTMWLSLLRLGDLKTSVAALCKEFDVDSKIAARDLEALVEKLINKGFLVRDPVFPGGEPRGRDRQQQALAD